MAETMVLGGGGVESERRMGERNPLRALPRTSRREVRPGHNRGLRAMTLIIFADTDGCARSIRRNCVQPGISNDNITIGGCVVTSAIYTAVMEVWYV